MWTNLSALRIYHVKEMRYKYISTDMKMTTRNAEISQQLIIMTIMTTRNVTILYIHVKFRVGKVALLVNNNNRNAISDNHYKFRD